MNMQIACKGIKQQIVCKVNCLLIHIFKDISVIYQDAKSKDLGDLSQHHTFNVKLTIVLSLQ